MKSIFAAALVGTISASTVNHIQIAESYNRHRSQCNAATDLPDGISERKKDMTTQSRYKNMLLADCEGQTDTDKKLTCIQGNVWLKTGAVNYVNYVGERKQSNTCKKLQHIPVCKTMCNEFFLFWHEPIPGSCERVKPEWQYECELRVKLIKENSAELWEAAAETQRNLDALFPNLEARYIAEAPVLHVSEVNPWLPSKYGKYDLTDLEIKTLTDAFNAKETVNEKCAVLGGWDSENTKHLNDGYAQGDVLLQAEAWYTEREATADWADFLSGNDRKTVALSRLALNKCKLGNNVCYEPTDACDAVHQFYRDQQTAINALRHVQVGRIRDYESISKSNLEMQKIKADCQRKITDKRVSLGKYVLTIQGQADRIAQATAATRIQNQRIWRKCLNIEAKQNAVQASLFAENERVNGLIKALIAKGKGREAELIANLI